MNSKHMNEVSQIDWARLAAYVDGEGYVAITKKSRKQGRWNWQAFDVSIRVANTDIRLPKWCADLFGGSVNVAYGKNYRKGIRPLYTWSVYGAKSRWIFEGILPYSIIKQDQIKVALAFLDTVKSGREVYRKGRYVPDSIKIARGELYEQLKKIREPKDLIQ